MPTLAQIGDNALRKLGLGVGNHEITLAFASISDLDTITVSGITLICNTGASPIYETAAFKKETDGPATAQNLVDLITSIFDDSTGVSASASSSVVTVIGARSVATSNASGFAISQAQRQDEPPLSSDIQQWTLDAQLDVTDKVADSALAAGDSGNMVAEFSVTGADSALVALDRPTGLLRIIEATAQIASDAQNYRLRKVERGIMLTIREGTNSLFKVETADAAQKFVSLWNDKIQFSDAPVTATTPLIIGVKEPQEVLNVACDLPDHLIPYVEDYVVVKALLQKEQAGLASTRYQMYLADLGAINARYGR